jgi:hypothetical protein
MFVRCKPEDCPAIRANEFFFSMPVAVFVLFARVAEFDRHRRTRRKAIATDA